MSWAGEPSEFTRAANATMRAELPFDDREDFEDARRGLVAPLGAAAVVMGANGFPVWDVDRFAFIEEGSEAPDTVNPSLWRQSQLTNIGGLFEVTDRLYQVRNADLSNLTIVEGETGLIVFDPLITTEAAAAAMELYFSHRPRRPVVAVVYSHSHVDHYGGVKGVVSEEDVASGRVRVIAPEGFLEAAVSENILAGVVMTRRSMYMYGLMLPSDPKGQVGLGLGMGLSLGSVTLIPPTETITDTGQRLEIDGLTFEFLLAPDTEAPSEMHWYIEELRALTASENCCHTLHNTYTIRGAPIRDPKAWSRYLNETIDRWGDRAEVLYGMHHWPVWGAERVKDLVGKARDAYRFINDETLRLASHGLTPAEIAEQVHLPSPLDRHWALRGYYGSVNHNVRATYVKYLGWYDGNPANLHTLPPEESASRYVEVAGGAQALLEKGRQAYDRGEYRWVAELVNHLVFADPEHREARMLQAAALEQMGYQSESATWRNAYLMGALELRNGMFPVPVTGTGSPDSVRAMSLDLFFDYLGVRFNGAAGGHLDLTLNFVLTDTGEEAVLEVVHGVVNHSLGRTDPAADATVTLTRGALDRFVLGEATLSEEAARGEIHVDPDPAWLEMLGSNLDTFDVWFHIVEP